MIHSKIPLAQTVVQLCKLKNIKHIVISPGSRNAPLTIGFTSDSFFKCYSVVDERCAAFFALGIAQQIQEPVVIACTSGSALLNYYPAISEAFFSDIPLVVLSADRPKHLIGIGDGQTINQKDVFANHILFATNLKLDLHDKNGVSEKDELPIFKNLENKLERFLGLQRDIQSFNEEEINKALNLSCIKKGPVHINVPFDEPLYERIEELTVSPKSVELDFKIPKIDQVDLKDCIDEWYVATKKMILIGVLEPNQIEQQWLEELVDDDSVIIFTETTSNLHHPNLFPSIDKIIAPLEEDDFKVLQPDILITFGGMVVSKKIKAFLREYQPKHHWHIDEKKANDTFFCLDKHIVAKPNDFLSEFLPKITHVTKSKYLETWTAIKRHRTKKHLEYVKQIPFSDFKVFSRVLKTFPNKSIVQLGNSSTVRYAQLFNMNPLVDVYCNRGTSGIDGSTSTAIGCATATNKQTVFISGDLSFFYDSNALWNNYIPKNFRIILINNEGGGIFRILPGHKNTDNFDYFFETTHHLTAKQLCEMFHFEYLTARNEEELETCLKTFYNASKSPRLLEIFTPRTANDTILLDYFNYVK
ncbi:2-succinyl-5-enolpyruvyl-6-hydroxy-3-cyclohexene-1-carboxylate synthase [Formosa sp. Hel1_31_208]|uniref:2-succinyl-5-enolpyruvyl-6-hydroxy-3- cyclohexene-1-carboxylate synthase n=1 Tax=Formosa sp. Hel1_31_208 TaxID=1798225 RepID=UPI00087CB2F3|nr:thiamine pyrophosphate-binding protein [Formosa sp. Hel1_31_208]SDS48320.1 2-succinyl-5-enolpyruvyl-6-hydroxy-3-cyclohexene-1-carboxylate synthase [Formosa sp. Hel1_31_208]